MKITLISPYESLWAYGLRLLSAKLKSENHKVKMIFLPLKYGKGYHKTTLDDLIKETRDSDLIGISLSTIDFHKAVQITKTLKNKFNTPIVWGGIHPTIKPDECIKYADIICIGEGEITLTKLINRIQKNKNYLNIKGLWIRLKNNQIIKNRPRSITTDINELPTQDFNLKNHFRVASNKHIKKMNFDTLSKQLTLHNTMAVRGCPFGCSYCCNYKYNKLYSGQQIVRIRSVENVIEELESAIDKLPYIKEICLVDDLFFINTLEYIKEFAYKYKSRINLPLLIAGGHPSQIDEKKINSLEKVGLKQISMGIQTGSPKTKKLFKRYTPNKIVLNSTKIINKFSKSVEVNYHIILDNPWENDEDTIKTLRFMSKIPVPYKVTLFSLVLYPGTELYKKAKKEGIIKNEDKQIYNKDFLKINNNFYNKIFYILKELSIRNKKISESTMIRLTSKKYSRLYLDKLIYLLIKTYVNIIIFIELESYNPKQLYKFYKKHILLRQLIRKKGNIL